MGEYGETGTPHGSVVFKRLSYEKGLTMFFENKYHDIILALTSFVGKFTNKFATIRGH